MASQAKLPHTMPTPRQARSNLREAVANFRTKRVLTTQLEDDCKRAKSELKTADHEIDEAEGDLLASAEDSPEDLDASARLAKAVAHEERAERDLEKVQDILRRSRLELDGATKILRGARGDIRALQEGRRKS